MDPSIGSSLLFGMLPAHPRLLENLGYQLNGLVVVFLALSIIWGTMEIIGLYFKRKAAIEEAEAQLVRLAAEEAAALAAAEAAKNGLPTELIAAIAAAAQVVLRDKRHRVHAIVPAASDWAREGRRQIFASHAIR